MKHLGDITQINGREASLVDVIIGGSPCQDLSAAGKRAGLKGERSGLFMEQIRIIKEMREASANNGATEIRPRYMVWENVVGVFSSNGCEDFRAVLEETVRIVDQGAVIPRPPRGKWQTCGCIVGNGYSIAWRVLDAQFWGVPQRRRRIALVADFGGGTAPEILFERKGVCGSTASGGETRQGTAAAAERNAGAAIEQSGTLKASCDDAAVCFDITHANDVIRECGEISPTLQNRMGTGGNQVPICYSLNLLQHPVPNYEKATSLGTGNGRSGQGSLGVCYREASYGDYEKGAGTLKASGGCLGGGSETLTVKDYKIRRLTPLECERLQGYPDGWTDIGDWIDSKGKKRESSDAARYKALGNSIALPPWKWVLKRLSARYNRSATMASLFDGIGGFPLIWEEINGKGSCLWASEIEEFPIAVTKKRVGE